VKKPLIVSECDVIIAIGLLQLSGKEIGCPCRKSNPDIEMV
jgi:hypothetical protein